MKHDIIHRVSTVSPFCIQLKYSCCKTAEYILWYNGVMAMIHQRGHRLESVKLKNQHLRLVPWVNSGSVLNYDTCGDSRNLTRVVDEILMSYTSVEYTYTNTRWELNSVCYKQSSKQSNNAGNCDKIGIASHYNLNFQIYCKT